MQSLIDTQESAWEIKSATNDVTQDKGLIKRVESDYHLDPIRGLHSARKTDKILRIVMLETTCAASRSPQSKSVKNLLKSCLGL